MCSSIEFYEGERKEIRAVICSKISNETVVVTSAVYELKRKYGEDVLFEGNCEIKGSELTVLLETDEKGSYELKIRAEIGREKIIEKVSIEVR